MNEVITAVMTIVFVAGLIALGKEIIAIIEYIASFLAPIIVGVSAFLLFLYFLASMGVF